MGIKNLIKNILGRGTREYLIDKIVAFRSYRYSKLSPDKYPEMLKIIYHKQTGKDLNLDNPQTFNEKIQWMKLYDNTPLKTRLADKYLMKQYVSEIVGDKYVVKLLGVWDTASEIDSETLPQCFVLKTNHSCHTNIIVHDKAKLNIAKTRRKLDKWLRINAEFMN